MTGVNSTLNKKIVDWIVKRAEHNYADDISLILLYGSFINGTANSRSDVDCYFIPKTERGYQFAIDFIIDGIGYDIFPMSWERVKNIVNLKEVIVPCVGDVEILFYNSKEDLDKFQRLQKQLKKNLENKEYTQSIAQERFKNACDVYAQMGNCNGLADVRACAGNILMTIADAVAVYNQDYFHFGLKKQYEDLQKFKNVPENFIELYLSIIQAEKVEEIKSHCRLILKSLSEYMGWEFIQRNIDCEEDINRKEKTLDYKFLAEIYEEISSTFNKIYICSEKENYILAFLSAVCLQNEFNELSQEQGIPHYDILSSYHYDNLSVLEKNVQEIEKDFIRLITDGGGTIKVFSNYEDFEERIENYLTL